MGFFQNNLTALLNVSVPKTIKSSLMVSRQFYHSSKL